MALLAFAPVGQASPAEMGLPPGVPITETVFCVISQIANLTGLLTQTKQNFTYTYQRGPDPQLPYGSMKQ